MSGWAQSSIMLIGHALATAVYLFAAVLGRSHRGEQAGGRAVSVTIAIGIALHSVSIYGLHLQDPPVPLESFPLALSLIGWLIAAAYLGALSFARVGRAGPWVALLAATFTLIAELALQVGAGVEPLPVLRSSGRRVHGGLRRQTSCSITASNVSRRGWPVSKPSGMRACAWALRKASERVQPSKASRLAQVE